MAKPKFNYDSEEFYKEIYALAMQGLNDGEIAYSLGDNLGVVTDEDGRPLRDEDGKEIHNEAHGLTPTTFADMKNGKYKGWTDEENERRSKRISEELAHGRSRVLGIVRGRYLKAALGGIKIKGKVTRKRYNVINGQADMDNMVMEETNSESETAPNMQALANFLYHHDPQFRNIQKGIEEGDMLIKVKNGVSISRWLEKENDEEHDKDRAVIEGVGI